VAAFFRCENPLASKDHALAFAWSAFLQLLQPATRPGRRQFSSFVSKAVVFIDENGDGPGVRLRKRSKENSRK
jgi:hypothetical protein